MDCDGKQKKRVHVVVGREKWQTRTRTKSNPTSGENLFKNNVSSRDWNHGNTLFSKFTALFFMTWPSTINTSRFGFLIILENPHATSNRKCGAKVPPPQPQGQPSL
jgi:hypothetical protein